MTTSWASKLLASRTFPKKARIYLRASPLAVSFPSALRLRLQRRLLVPQTHAQSIALSRVLGAVSRPVMGQQERRGGLACRHLLRHRRQRRLGKPLQTHHSSVWIAFSIPFLAMRGRVLRTDEARPPAPLWRHRRSLRRRRQRHRQRSPPLVVGLHRLGPIQTSISTANHMHFQVLGTPLQSLVRVQAEPPLMTTLVPPSRPGTPITREFSKRSCCQRRTSLPGLPILQASLPRPARSLRTPSLTISRSPLTLRMSPGQRFRNQHYSLTAQSPPHLHTKGGDHRIDGGHLTIEPLPTYLEIKRKEPATLEFGDRRPLEARPPGLSLQPLPPPRSLPVMGASKATSVVPAPVPKALGSSAAQVSCQRPRRKMRTR